MNEPKLRNSESEFLRQTRALLRRNVLLFSRDYGNIFLLVLLPLVYIILIPVMNNVAPASLPFPSEPVSEPVTVPLNGSATLPNPLVVAFTPGSSSDAARVLDSIVDPNICELCTFANATLLPLADDKEVEAYIRNEKGPMHVAIEFLNLEDDGSFPPAGTVVEIVIRFNGSVVPETEDKFLPDTACRTNSTCPALQYITSGLLDLESELAHALALELPGAPKLRVDGTTQFFPQPPLAASPTFLKIMAPIWATLAFWPFTAVALNLVVQDKQKKLKEGMRVMGLSTHSYILSWLIVFGSLGLAMALIMSIIVVQGGFYAKSNLFLVFINFYLYCISMIAFCFCVSPFFIDAKKASGVGAFFASVVGVLYIPLTISVLPGGVYYACSLLSPIAFTLALGQAVILEQVDGRGLQFDTVWVSENGFSYGSSLVMLLLDIVFYFFLAWYLDQVWSADGSAVRHPLFLFSSSFWRSSRSAPMDPTWTQPPDVELQTGLLDSNDVEQIPPSANVVISISGMNKTYPRPDLLTGSAQTQALQDVSLDMVEGQIFGLLGHNGAGKSTLMSILSGSVVASSGSATIYGHKVETDMPTIRSHIGFCPQHNLIIDYLTVVEHLNLYLGIKGGVPTSEFRTTIANVLEQFELAEIANQVATTLSGGQKRKLSIAIAMIGAPKVVILDEPTAGMDVHARRKVWDILQQNKAGRVIIVASHFLDEIDVLTDRKAILSRGHVRCCGTSIFIKSRFGLGYNLYVDMDEKLDTKSHEEKILSVIKQYVLGATVDNVSRSFRLPQTYATSFPSLFVELDRQKESLGIKFFNVGMTTLEDVFLLLEHEASAHHEAGREDEEQEAPDLPQASYAPPGRLAQFRALTHAKFRHILRNPGLFSYVIGYAILQQVIGMVIGTLNPGAPEKNDQQPAVPLYEFSMVSPDPVPVVYNNESSWGNNITSQFSIPWFHLNEVSASFIDSLVNSTVSCLLKLNGSDNPSFHAEVGLMVQPRHLQALPIYWSQVASASLASVAAATLGTSVESGMNITMQPLPSPVIPINGNALGSTLLLAISLAVLPFTLTVEVVREKKNGVRHQLLVMGLDPFVYWMSCLARDLAIYWILGLSTIILILAFGIPCLNGPAIFPVILCLILYLPVSMLCAYLASFLVKTPEVFMNITLIPVLLVVIPLVLVMVLVSIGNGSLSLTLHYIFMAVDPLYGFAGTMSYICDVQVSADRRQLGTVTMANYFDWASAIPGSLLIILAHGLLLSGVLAAIENHWCTRHQGRVAVEDESEIANDMDSDVRQERVRLAQATDDALIAQGLRKVYRVPPKPKQESKPSQSCQSQYRQMVVVDNLWFGINRGECFGLLGPNGAGKTTSIAMLTGEIQPTRGRQILAGFDMSTHAKEAFQRLGFCPQFDALSEDLSVRENLTLFAKIKGIPNEDIPSHVKALTAALGIEEHIDKVTRNLSGGTRRKVSFCIAVIANQEVVVLDEPSTGLDPASRRFLWKVIRSNVGGRACLLTTHSMEEADALCTRIGIMVKGKLCALGTSQHLKQKFSDGYQLEIQLVESRREDLSKFISNKFPANVLVQEDHSRLLYKIPSKSIGSLGDVFASLQKQREMGVIEEYSFSQATLSQVFTQIVKREQVVNGDGDAGA